MSVWGKLQIYSSRRRAGKKREPPPRRAITAPQQGTLKWHAWEQLLPYNDPKRDFILKGILEGFHIVCDKSLTEFLPVEMKNYRSAIHKDIAPLVERQILDELSNGQYIIVDSKPRIISALGAIPKKGCKKVRLIHDCSRPAGYAINDFATHNPFKYQSIQDAIDYIKPNSFLAKIDLANAYRVVKLHPSNYELTGLQWTFTGMERPTYMVDTCLPFGARLAPQIFNELSQAVRRILASRNIHKIVTYLDDFLVVGDTYDECLSNMNELMLVLRALGFRINYSKVEGPKQKLTFLGLELNCISRTISLPSDKVRELFDYLKIL